ncbi:hypothetical protein Acsp05_21610 [Actinokineospora sp. NBRC 105648]|nr:hypothetical protein Acsp05_21610 [Actinokineospora sp. NBRC 105648]
MTPAGSARTPAGSGRLATTGSETLPPLLRTVMGTSVGTSGRRETVDGGPLAARFGGPGDGLGTGGEDCGGCGAGSPVGDVVTLGDGGSGVVASEVVSGAGASDVGCSDVGCSGTGTSGAGCSGASGAGGWGAGG